MRFSVPVIFSLPALYVFTPRSESFRLLDEVTAPRRSKGFCLGLRGWVEVQRYKPGERPHRKFRDLAWLVDQVAACIVRHRQEGVEGASRP